MFIVRDARNLVKKIYFDRFSFPAQCDIFISYTA